MARPRSPLRDKAMRLWLESNKKRMLKDIAKELEVSEVQIRKWKNQDAWDKVTLPKRKGNKISNVTKRKGGQLGNKNATGPPGNKHAEKHGFFSKWLPAETLEIINAMSEDPLELLWDQVTFQYAAIVRAQNLMYVKDQEDKTVDKIGESSGKVNSETWTVQQAWDKHNTFMSAQARSVKAFLSTVKEYEELLHKRWDMSTDEQKQRIELLKAQTEATRLKNVKKETEEYEDDGFMDALTGTATKDWEDYEDK